MPEKGKKKKTTRKVGYADDSRSPSDPFGSGAGPADEGVDDSEDWNGGDTDEYEESEDSTDTDSDAQGVGGC